MEINCPFKKHKNLLGKPGKGIHSYRFLNIAIMDYIQTIGVSMLTTYLTKIPLVLTTIFWLILGIILHILFGVETEVVKYLGIKCK